MDNSQHRFPVKLTQAQRRVIAEIVPELADRLKLNEKPQRTIQLTVAELKAIKEKAGKAVRHASTGMVRNSLRHVIDLTAHTLERSQGTGAIPSAERVFQFKIKLKDSHPPIWRRIQVKDCTLDKLHEHIQTAMGWTNSHLHHFHIGEQPFALDLTMPTEQVADWPAAIASCKDPAWENVELEAQNQLTLWLHLNTHAEYQKWNDIVLAHKASVLNPLIEQNVIPFQVKHGLDIALIHSVQWDILGALMESSYLGSGHKAFFFLELFMVYEAGHLPCGWVGEWPQGSLRVY